MTDKKPEGLEKGESTTTGTAPAADAEPAKTTAPDDLATHMLTTSFVIPMKEGEGLNGLTKEERENVVSFGGISNYISTLEFSNMLSDKKKKAQLYKIAADMGDQDYILKYAEILENGNGIPKDEEMALEYYYKVKNKTKEILNKIDKFDKKIVKIENSELSASYSKKEKNSIKKILEAAGYKNLEELGKGGFGSVFKTKDGRAIKISEANGEDFNTEKKNSFEINSLGGGFGKTLESRRIKLTNDSGTATYFLIEISKERVMDLHTMIRKKSNGESNGIVGDFSPIAGAIQLVNALEKAHLDGLILADIKPENILINEKGICKLADFGLTKKAKEYIGNYNKGTPGYKSPEIDNESRITQKADVYALGATLYQMLTGKDIFEGEKDSGKIDPDKIKLEDIDLSKLYPGVNFGENKEEIEKKFFNLVKSMINENIDQRPTIFEVKEQLAQITEYISKICGVNLEENLKIRKKDSYNLGVTSKGNIEDAEDRYKKEIDKLIDYNKLENEEARKNEKNNSKHLQAVLGDDIDKFSDNAIACLEALKNYVNNNYRIENPDDFKKLFDGIENKRERIIITKRLFDLEKLQLAKVGRRLENLNRKTLISVIDKDPSMIEHLFALELEDKERDNLKTKEEWLNKLKDKAGENEFVKVFLESVEEEKTAPVPVVDDGGDKKIDAEPPVEPKPEPKTTTSNLFDKFIYEQLENKKDKEIKFHNSNEEESEEEQKVYKYKELCVDKTLEEAKSILFKNSEVPDGFEEICDKYFKVFLINNPDTDGVARRLYDFYYLYEQSKKFKENGFKDIPQGAIPRTTYKKNDKGEEIVNDKGEKTLDKEGYDEKDNTIDTDAFKDTSVSAVSTDLHGSMNAALFFLLDSGVAKFKKNSPTFVYYDMVSRKAYNSIEDFLVENKDATIEEAGFLKLIPNLEINEGYEGKAVNCGDLIDAGSYSDEVVATFSYLEEQKKDKIIRICGNHEISGYNSKTDINLLNWKNREFTYRDILEDKIRLYYADGGVLYSHTMPLASDLKNGIEYIEKFKTNYPEAFKELFKDFNDGEFTKLKEEIENISKDKSKTLSPECTNLLPKYFNPLLKIHSINMLLNSDRDENSYNVDRNNKILKEILEKYPNCSKLDFNEISNKVGDVDDIIQPDNPTIGLSGNRSLGTPICNCIFGHTPMRDSTAVYKNGNTIALDADNGQTENKFLKKTKIFRNTYYARTNAFFIKLEVKNGKKIPKAVACTMDVEKDFDEFNEKNNNLKIDLNEKGNGNIFKNDISPTINQAEAQKEQKARLARIQADKAEDTIEDTITTIPEPKLDPKIQEEINTKTEILKNNAQKVNDEIKGSEEKSLIYHITDTHGDSLSVVGALKQPGFITAVSEKVLYYDVERDEFLDKLPSKDGMTWEDFKERYTIINDFDVPNFNNIPKGTLVHTGDMQDRGAEGPESFAIMRLLMEKYEKLYIDSHTGEPNLEENAKKFALKKINITISDHDVYSTSEGEIPRTKGILESKGYKNELPNVEINSKKSNKSLNNMLKRGYINAGGFIETENKDMKIYASHSYPDANTVAFAVMVAILPYNEEFYEKFGLTDCKDEVNNLGEYFKNNDENKEIFNQIKMNLAKSLGIKLGTAGLDDKMPDIAEAFFKKIKEQKSVKEKKKISLVKKYNKTLEEIFKEIRESMGIVGDGDTIQEGITQISASDALNLFSTVTNATHNATIDEIKAGTRKNYDNELIKMLTFRDGMEDRSDLKGDSCHPFINGKASLPAVPLANIKEENIYFTTGHFPANLTKKNENKLVNNLGNDWGASYGGNKAGDNLTRVLVQEIRVDENNNFVAGVFNPVAIETGENREAINVETIDSIKIINAEESKSQKRLVYDKCKFKDYRTILGIKKEPTTIEELKNEVAAVYGTNDENMEYNLNYYIYNALYLGYNTENVKQDKNKAIRLIKLAADNGYTHAMHYYAWILQNDKDIGINKEESLKYYKKYYEKTKDESVIETIKDLEKEILQESIIDIKDSEITPETTKEEILKLIINNENIAKEGYKVGDKLGEGGQGAVFKMDDGRAIKITEFKEKDYAKEFANEEKVSSMINPLGSGFGKTLKSHRVKIGDRYFLIEISKERLTDLDKVIEGQPTITDFSPMAGAIQLVNALEKAHLNGMILADIKPLNIFVNENGVCKLADFGLTGKAEECKNLYGIGTPYYQAPEIKKEYREDENHNGKINYLTQKADVYALGLTLSEMFTGDRTLNINNINLAKFYPNIDFTKNPELKDTLKEKIYYLIKSMTEEDIDKRPTIFEVKEKLAELAEYVSKSGIDLKKDLKVRDKDLYGLGLADKAYLKENEKKYKEELELLISGNKKDNIHLQTVLGDKIDKLSDNAIACLNILKNGKLENFNESFDNIIDEREKLIVAKRLLDFKKLQLAKQEGRIEEFRMESLTSIIDKNPEMIEYLFVLDLKADEKDTLETKEQWYQKLFEKALERNDGFTIKFLSSTGIGKNLIDSIEGENLNNYFKAFCKYGDVEIVEGLLGNENLSEEAVKEGFVLACENGNDGILKELLNKKEDILNIEYIKSYLDKNIAEIKNKEIFEILTKEINEENIIGYFNRYIEVEEDDIYQGNPAIINLFLEKDYIKNNIENIKRVICLQNDGLNLETFEYLFKKEELLNDKECAGIIFGYYCENGKLDEIKNCIGKIKGENERKEIIKNSFTKACDNKKFEAAQFLLNEYDFVKDELNSLILSNFKKDNFDLETVNFLIENGGKFDTKEDIKLGKFAPPKFIGKLKKLREGYSDKIKNKLNEVIEKLNGIKLKDKWYYIETENLKNINGLLDDIRKEMTEKKAKGREVVGGSGADDGELGGGLKEGDVKKNPIVPADNNSENKENNNKYLIPEDSNTIKKLKMFNDDIYIPEDEIKEEKIQKVSNRLNKDKKLYDEKKEEYIIKGGDEKTLKPFKAKKKYNDNDIEKYNKKERKEKSYLEYEMNDNSGRLKNLFASRFFNYMGYPTFNAYLLSNNNKPLFEKIEGNAVESASTFYKDENIMRQFIKRNITTVFFGDTDAHLKNIMYNSATKEVKLIDLNITEPVGRFNVNEIFFGKDTGISIDSYYILDMSDNNKNIIDSCRSSKLLERQEIANKINDNHVNIVKNEYFNLQKKLFLINNEDLDFITLSNNEELSKDDEFLKEVNEFKKTIELHKVKSFYWMYTQNNLYQLFNLSKEYEEKLHNLFNIDEFLKNNTINDVSDYDEYAIFLNSLSETPEFKNFASLANSFSKKNEKENYQNPNELFFDNKSPLEEAINSSKNFDEFIEKFNLDLGINEKSNKKEETPPTIEPSNVKPMPTEPTTNINPEPESEDDKNNNPKKEDKPEIEQQKEEPPITDTEVKPKLDIEPEPETPLTAEPSNLEPTSTEPTTNLNPKSEDNKIINLEEEDEPEIEQQKEEDEPETIQTVTPEQQQKQEILKTRVEHYEKKVENLQNSNKTIKSAQKSSKSNSEPAIDNITSKIKEEGRKSDKEFDKIAKEAEITVEELLNNEKFKEVTLLDVGIENEDGTVKNYEKGFGGTVTYYDDGKVEISFKEDGFLMEQLVRMNLGAEYNDVINIFKSGIIIENAKDEELKNFFIKIKTNPAKAYIELCKNKDITINVDNDTNDKIKGAFAIATDTRKALDCVNYVSKRLDSILDNNYKKLANILIKESMNIIKTGEISKELRSSIVTSSDNKDIITILKHSTELLYAIENQNKDLNEINNAIEKKDIEEQRAKLAEICKNPSLTSFAKFLNGEKLKDLRRANKILNRLDRKEIVATLL